MSPFVLLALTILIFTAFAVGAIYLLYQLLINFQPGSTKVNNDLSELKNEIAPWVDELVPWNQEELELLSLKQSNRILKKRIVTTVKGIFTSIYHEPLIAYAYKQYVAKGRNAILYARTSHHEFVYRIKQNEIKIIIDQQNIGTLRKGGLLYSSRTDSLIGKIQPDRVSGLLPVVIGDRELGSLTLDENNTMGKSTRAFQFLSEKISDEEEALMLSVSILEMVQNELPNKNK